MWGPPNLRSSAGKCKVSAKTGATVDVAAQRGQGMGANAHVGAPDRKVRPVRHVAGRRRAARHQLAQRLVSEEQPSGSLRCQHHSTRGDCQHVPLFLSQGRIRGGDVVLLR